jgi:hypothetical protein
MTEDDLVEVMARAIGEQFYQCQWPEISQFRRSLCLDMARAAFTAIRGAGLAVLPREPTPDAVFKIAEMLTGAKPTGPNEYFNDEVYSRWIKQNSMKATRIYAAMVEAGKIGES